MLPRMEGKRIYDLRKGNRLKLKVVANLIR